MKKHINLLKLIFILCMVVFVSSCGEEDGRIESEIKVPVSVEVVKHKNIESFIESTGTVYPTGESTLKANLTGKYRLLKNPATGKPFALGDFVKNGQTIIRVEDMEFINNVQIESKKLNLEVSKNNFDKQQSLYEKGGVTLRELKNSEIEYINAKYSYDNAALQISKTVVRAPFAGTIVDLPYFTQGVLIEQGVDLIKVMDYSKLLLDVKLSEKHINSIKINQDVIIMNYTLGADTLFGKISQISPAIDPESRTFKSLLSIDNPELKLRPGMFVKAKVLTSSSSDAIVIPKNIVLSRQSEKIVYIVENGIAIEKSINSGIENSEEIEVIEGLKENDRIVVTGFETLRDKSKVNIVK